MRRRAESLGLLLLSPTGLVGAIDQIIARIPEGDAAGDLRRFKERLGGEVRLTYRHFLDVATSFLRHLQPSWDSFVERHREELDGQARWLLDRLPSECEGMSDLKEVRARLVEGVYPLHPLAALLLCRYLVNKLEQHRTLGKMFVPEDGELAAWARRTPVFRDGKLQWFTALDVIRFYRDSLTDRRFLDTWREAEAALANALPEAGDKDQDTLMAIAMIEGLPLPWPATEDMLARITGWSEEEIRQSLKVLLAEGIVTRTGQGWYRLDIGRRKIRLRYEEELEKALKERPATSNQHPAYWLNGHLTRHQRWMEPAKVGLPASIEAKLGDSPFVRPEAFLRQRDIVTTDQSAVRAWSWRLEYISASGLNMSSLKDKIRTLSKANTERSGFVLRVLPINDTELAQARQQLDKILQELEGTELSKRFVIVCPEAPVYVVEPLEKLYIYGKQWESNGLSREFADLIKEDRQNAVRRLQGALEEAYTSPNVRWEAPGVQIMVGSSREHGVVSQILKQRFDSAPPMPQVLNKPSLNRLIPSLLRDEIAQLIRIEKKGAKARLIAEQVLKNAWQVLDPGDLSLHQPPQGTSISAAYQLLDSLWANVDGGKQMLRWSDAKALFKEPYGYGENDTWRLLIACYLGWRMRRTGGQLESIEYKGSPAVRLRKNEDAPDIEPIIEHFTTLVGIGVKWTPPELLETEEAPATVVKPPAFPIGSGVEPPGVGPQVEPDITTVPKPDKVRESEEKNAPSQTSAVEGILDQFEALEQEDKVQAVDAMYRKLPKDAQEKQLEAWMYEV